MLPSFFLSHGGGPWPYMADQVGDSYAQMQAALASLPGQLGGAVRAVLMVSAHWEEAAPALASSPWPPMLYDYSGFPAATYAQVYGAPGAPALAARAAALLGAAGIAARLDPMRGIDHGAVALMHAMYPAARMPLLLMSLQQGLDPQAHLAMGRALAPLRRDGVLIVGSGQSYHNAGRFGRGGQRASQLFDGWLQFVLGLPPSERSAAMLHWSGAPYARLAHPREEHLMPLLVALGAAEQEAAALVYHEDAFFGGLALSSFRFGA